MEQQTLDAINNTLTTMQNVGFGIVMAFVIMMMVFAYIIDRRSRSKLEASDSKQNEQVLILLAKAIDNKDTDTARAITNSTDNQKAIALALNNNTEALKQNADHSKDIVVATHEQTDILTALRKDVKEWPSAVISALGVLEKSFDELKSDIDSLMKDLPKDSILMPVLHDMQQQLAQILTLLTPPPQPAFAKEDALGARLLMEEKRKTDQMKKSEPPDKEESAA